MQIKQDPVSKLWVREDGAVLMPPTGYHFKRFRWTFGSKQSGGYRGIRYKGESCQVHRLVCRAFHGLPPESKPEVDHINRIKDDNRPSNLHWVDHKENDDNRDYVDQALAKYGIRQCDDPKSYFKAHYRVNREGHKARYAAKAAKMKAQGLTFRRGPDGKQGWFPRLTTALKESNHASANW